jgi:hypothetical protein
MLPGPVHPGPRLCSVRGPVAPKKRLLRILLLVVLAVAAVVLAVFAWRADTRRLRRRLLEDVQALATARYARPVQALPVLPGRFGAAAADAWTQLAALEAVSTDVEFCRAVRDGETAVEKAPPSCLRELSRGEAPLGALLLATHAEAAGPPFGLGALDAPAPAGDVRTFVTAAYAGRMAALQVRVQLGKGDTQGALSTCLDLLALARDVSFGTALQGRLAAFSVSEVAFSPCAAALDAASLPQKRAASVALSKIAEGTPTLAETLSGWSTRVRAQRFAAFLSPDVLLTLPDGVQAWARAENVPRRLDAQEAVALGNAWHALQSRLDAVVQAGALPGAACAERLSALSARAEPAFAALGHVDFPELGWVAQSDARVRAEVLLLRRAAEVDVLRAETGVWPLPEVLSEAVRSTAEKPFSLVARGPEAVLRDSTSPRGGLELLLHADR